MIAKLLVAAALLAAVPLPAEARTTSAALDAASAVVPGAACFSSHSIRLSHGAAQLPNRMGYPNPGSSRRVVSLHAGKAFYGQLTSGGATAVLPLICDNNGGTADGDLLFSLMVYTEQGPNVIPVGLITPSERPKDELVTIISRATIRPGRVTVPELFYGPNDATCCPTGRATTVWTYNGQRLIRGRTTVTHKPQSG